MNKIVAAAITAAVMMPAASFAADSKPSVKVGGGVQTDFRMGERGDQSQQEFNLRRARVSVSGKINPLIGFGIQLQGDNSGNTRFRDMFATLNFNPLAKVTVGQFKYEFDIEGRESSFDRSFMDRTYATNLLAGGVSSDFRDKGVQLSGVLDMGGMGAGYAFGVWNGNGANNSGSTLAGVTAPNPADNNNSLMYTANGFVSPMKGMKLNLGYMTNDVANEGAANEINLNNWTVGAAYDVGPLFARGEYYKGKQETTGVEAEASGWYVLGGYSVLPMVDVFARYQTLEDDNVDNSQISSIDLGTKYFFAKKGKHGGSNIAVNYMIRDMDANAIIDPRALNDNRGGPLISRTTGVVTEPDNVLAARLQVAF